MKPNEEQPHQGMAIDLPPVAPYFGRRRMKLVAWICNAVSKATCKGGRVFLDEHGGLRIEPGVSAGGSGSSSVQQYRLKAVGDTYLTCRTWDGAAEGAVDVHIAKNFKLRRNIVTATLDGVVVNYTYAVLANNLDGKRIATKPSNGTSEEQIVIPRYLVNDILYAVQVDGLPLFGVVQMEWLDLNVDGRAWARRA